MEGAGVTAEFLNGAGVVAVVVLLLMAFLRGWFVTKREADVYLERAERAEKNEGSLIEQNRELMEMARLGQATFTALRRAGED